MAIRNSITAKAVSLFLLLSLLILAVVHFYSFSVSRKIVVDLAEENSRAIAGNVSYRITSKFKPIETVVLNLAIALENPNLSAEAITNLSRMIVTRNENIFGSAVAFEPYGMFPDQLYFSPYSFKKDGTVLTKNLGSVDYRYFHLDWYQLPKQLGNPVWTEPYFDTGGGDILMSTFSVPFYREVEGEKVFAGVVTADISLVGLQDYVSDIRLYESGYAALLSGNGLFLYHPNGELVLNETIFSVAERLEDSELWEIGRDAISGGSDFIERISFRDGKQSFMYYRPLQIGGWSVFFLFPKEEVLQEITTMARRTLVINIIGFIVLALAIIGLTKRFTRPLINLSQSARKISGGDLDTVIPTLDSKDELGQLTVAFSEMQRSLKHHIKELTDTTAHRERIESELRIARNIQMSILPKLFPPFPERKEFDIYAMIRPAREIGGDLYDFFFIDKHRFCFLIGDVSDKGVPAAFFMAVTKTLLKVMAEQEPDPGAILTRVNDDLAEGNESCMFVTLFIGILDLRTGSVLVGNAGHNPPVLLNRDGVDFLPCLNEPLAGAIGDLTYTTSTIELVPGDTLILYTDGVTEAMDNEKNLYSDERLIEQIGPELDRHPEEIVGDIEQSVHDFAAGAEQSDDITVLCLRYNETSHE